MDAVVHFEIPTKKYDTAKKFYMDIFGWKIEEWPGMPNKYGMTTTTNDGKGGINGGLMEPSQPFENATIITISVASIDDYLAKITAAGGQMLMPKSPVGDMGFMARFSDLDGNTVGLWEDAKK